MTCSPTDTPRAPRAPRKQRSKDPSQRYGLRLLAWRQEASAAGGVGPMAVDDGYNGESDDGYIGQPDRGERFPGEFRDMMALMDHSDGFVFSVALAVKS